MDAFKTLLIRLLPQPNGSEDQDIYICLLTVTFTLENHI